MPDGGGAPDRDDERVPPSGEEPIDDDGVIDLELLAWNLGATLDDRGHLLPRSLLDYLR